MPPFRPAGNDVFLPACALASILDATAQAGCWSRGMHPSLNITERELAAFCAKHHIRRVALFGSILHGRARPDSDVDLLVDFESGQEPGLIALAAMEAELSALLGDRRVDMRTARDISRYFRDDVIKTAEVQYAR
jgi:predicted nucleotidyltransferase